MSILTPFSGPEFRDDQSFQATISIRPDLSTIDFPDELKELRSDVNQLKVILDALTTEILPPSSKTSPLSARDEHHHHLQEYKKHTMISTINQVTIHLKQRLQPKAGKQA